ncbi:MAG TPA: hypothetical protein DCF44_03920 [Chitinophagaceae bacterium]|nr:hypothetical protein [Chitinophagaceae bacterium]
MKTNRKKQLTLVLAITLLISKGFAQATSLGHLGTVPAFDWCGWNALSPIPFTLEHRGNHHIRFRIGPFAPNTSRMVIRGTNAGPFQGFVGIGQNFLTPNNLLDVDGGDIDINTPVRSYMIADRSVLWHKGDATNIFVGVQAGNNHAFNNQGENTFLGYSAGFSSPGSTPLGPSIRNTFVGSEAGFNSISSLNTYVGYRAGYSHNNSTQGNTCVGYECGYLNQNADNAFYGFRAARNQVSGIDNSVFGQVAGENMSTGSGNTFMGLAAGRGNGAFDNNNYFGARAGNSSLGSDNIFIGNNAGLNGIGSRNVVMGNFAMQAATAGTENVIIGYNANIVSPGTSFNTIIGGRSALVNATGSSNTYVGYQTALAQTTGTGHAYFGLEAGQNMVGGSGNTFLGIRAGATNANSTFTNAAAIGAGAQVVNNDHMILGNNAVNVGIGLSGITPGPGNKLEINTAVANTSGLRFRQLTSASPVGANPGPGVLAVDPNGDVIYVQSPAASAFGGTCGTSPSALPSSWEIPLGGFNYVFSGNGTGTVVNNVGIGTNCTPQAKLHVDQSSGSNAGSIGILVENNDISPCFNAGPIIGLKSVVNLANSSGTVSSLYRVGGWFEVPNPNGCGIINNWAIHVPQNGGFVTIGYPTPFTTGALVDINGVTNSALGYTSISDISLKNSVATLPNALNKIKNLRPVTFKWNNLTDSASSGTQAGFIAQEVDTVIPQVIRTTSSRLKSISYDQLIPYLVSAIQAQQNQIKQLDSIVQSLTQTVSSCCSNSAARQTGIQGNDPSNLSQINVNLSDAEIIVLDQNKPNPFAEQTTITYNVPEKYGFAQMIFKTIDGKIIKTVDITKKGRGQINVFANDLTNGLYTYSLIVDGATVDTKKMVKQN